MHLMMQQEPGEWVVATGETHSVYKCASMYSAKAWRADGQDYRQPAEASAGTWLPEGRQQQDSVTGLEPEYTFESMLDEMISHWMNHYKKGAFNPLEHEQTKWE